MLPFVLALAVGVIGGLITGGTLTALAATRFKAWALLLAALVGEAFLGVIPSWGRPVLAVTACLAITAWCLANRPGYGMSRGYELVALGVVLNATVMALNGGMPVSRPALAAAGLSRTTNVASGDLYKHVSMTSRTVFPQLGDVVPLHLAHTVVSAGDVLMLCGIVTLAWAATRWPRTGVQPDKLAS